MNKVSMLLSTTTQDAWRNGNAPVHNGLASPPKPQFKLRLKLFMELEPKLKL
jgi:hypothetical protein